MNADRWFYIDSAGTQFGPATAADVREALRLGRCSQSCLAWREGMATWQAIGSLSRELGLVPTAPPPPMRLDAPPSRETEADPYRAPQSDEMQAINRDDIDYAGFVRRFAAWFIDAIVVGVLAAVAAMPFVGNPVLGDVADPFSAMRAVARAQMPSWGINIVISMLYFTLQESSSAQATLGKRALGIKVTDLAGERLSFARALGRWAAATLSYLTLYIGFLMAAFTERKQGLHDLVAGTLVVDQWAYTAHPERQRRKPHGCALALLICMLVFAGMVVVAMVFAFAAIGSNLGKY